MLDLNHIVKIYHPGEVTESLLFSDFNLHIGDGEFISVVGSNGSGKTSLLNIICGSIPVESGQVLLDGADITREPEFKRYKTIGRVYQDPSVGSCGALTVAENMSLADNKGGRFDFSHGINRARLSFYREQLATLGLGLEDKMNLPVANLSGGQRQAMTLLMATMTPLRFLILDEHTAALDPKTAEIIMKLTDRIVKEKKLTAIMVTHNLRYAVEYGNRMLMMHRGTIILDRAGEEKANTCVDDILHIFNDISIECGN